MGLFDSITGGDDEEDSSSEDSGGIIDDVTDGVDDVVDDVSDTVDDAVDAGEEAAGDIAEGAGDVADEVSEGDVGGAVDEAADTVEDVASGSSDTGSSGSSGGSSSSSSGGSDDSGGFDFFDGGDDDGGGGGGSSDPSPEPSSSPEPDPSNADPSDNNGSDNMQTENVPGTAISEPGKEDRIRSSKLGVPSDPDNEPLRDLPGMLQNSKNNQKKSGTANNQNFLLNQLQNRPQSQRLPETEEEVDQAQKFRENNPIISAANPEIEDALDTREQNLEVRNQLDQQIENVQEAPENTQITFGEGENAETVSREEALDRLENRRSSVDRAMDQNEIILENRQRASSSSSGSSSQEEDPITDIGTFLNPLDGNPDQSLDEEALTAGIDLMQKGQDFGDEVGDLVPRPGDGKEAGLNIARDITEDLGIGSEEDRQRAINQFERFWPEAPAQTSSAERGIATLSEGADQISDAIEDNNVTREEATDLTVGLARQQFGSGTEEQLDARENTISGVATGGSQLVGLGLSASGGSVRALDEDTPGLLEGAAAGPGVVADEVSEDPGEFVAEEAGEEVGEKIVFGSLTGGAGVVASSVPTPDFSPEVDPEFNPEVDPNNVNEIEPENDPEADLGRAGDPRDVEMEDLPSGFTQESAPDMQIEPVQENEVTEAGGLEVVRPGEGQTVYPNQPSSEEFNFEVEEGSADARATPTEPDRVNDPGEFRGEDPRTQFTDVEQEVVRELRGRDDVTIRQGDTVDDRGPGLNQPDPDQTVIEVEESATGGELMFSVMGPIPQSLVDPEPDVEINPQPDIQGPEPDLADTSPDADLADVGPEVGTETETEVEFEPETETEVEPDVDTSLDPRVDPAIDQGIDELEGRMQEEGQEFQQEQIPELDQRNPQQQTTQEPEPGPDKIMNEPGFEPEIDNRVEPRLEPEEELRSEPTPSGDFEEDSGGGRNPFSEEAVDPDADPEFNPSLGAVLFDVTSEEAPADDQVFTGTEVRPIPEDLEEEFDLPF